MNSRIKRAHEFAGAAHLGQERKFTGAPYTVHLEETAQLLWEVTDGKAETNDYVAAILHDTVEDTDVTLEEIGKEFGGEVMDLVSELTIDQELKEKEGKKPYLARRLNEMSSRALTIKLCDRFSNVAGLEDKRIPRDFVKWYVRETQYILENLTCELNADQKYLTYKICKMLIYLRLDRNF